MALFLYGGVATLLIIAKPELFTTMQDMMLVLTPFIAMFTWDKIKGGSLVPSKT